MIKFLYKIAMEARFKPSILSCFLNPNHIIRSELFGAIAKHASRAEGELLDFGCGEKPYEALFSNVTRYIGCDIQVSGHDHSKSKVDYFYNGKTLPFEDNRFDYVVSFETFEHLFNLEEILNELHRTLKPGGSLLISAPFCWDEHEVPFDFARYTSYGLSFLLEKNGFKIIDYQKTGTYILCIFQIFETYLYQHVLPRKYHIRLLLTPLLIFPVTLLAYLSNFIFPKRNGLFLNSVVLCIKN